MPGLSSPCTAGCFKNHAGCGVHRSGQTPVFLGPEATTVSDRENFPHSLHAHGLYSWLSLTAVTGPCGCVALPQQVKPYRAGPISISSHGAGCLQGKGIASWPRPRPSAAPPEKSEQSPPRHTALRSAGSLGLLPAQLKRDVTPGPAWTQAHSHRVTVVPPRQPPKGQIGPA